MNRINALKIARMLLLLGALLVLAGGETQAWYGNAYYGGVSPVSYGTYSTVAYASYRPGYYYPGTLQRSASRIRARRAARAYNYSSYAPYYGMTSYYAGCCDPCGYVVAYPNCCCTLCCDPCCTCAPCGCGAPCGYGDSFYRGGDGFETTSCCAPALDYGDQPVPVPTDEPAPTEAPAATPTPAPEAADNSARIEVTLPADARVYVNDRLTTSTGSRRQYLSAGLHPGGSYAYRIRVEYQHQGQEMVELRTVRMRAGQRITIEFPNTELATTKTSVARLASLP